MSDETNVLRAEIERLGAELQQLRIRTSLTRTGAFMEFAHRLCALGLARETLTLRVPRGQWYLWLEEYETLRKYDVKRDANPLFEVMEFFGPHGVLLRVESEVE